MKCYQLGFLSFLLFISVVYGSPLVQNISTTIATTDAVIEDKSVKNASKTTWIHLKTVENATAAIIISTKEPTVTTESPTVVATTSTSSGVEVRASGAPTTAEMSSEYLIHRELSLLEEKLQALSCDLPPLPLYSRIWKGNETHELLLPIKCVANEFLSKLKEKYDANGWSKQLYDNFCVGPTGWGVLYPSDKIPSPCSSPASKKPNSIKTGKCVPFIWNWEGIIEIQTGDVLLVRIDDSLLIRKEFFLNRSRTLGRNFERILHEPPTAVYQVTRTGHEHCDITEGILLDINPLKIDNRKVVTLYDKDLTEGINLLIVVSELWGNQCVRLRVTVKSDNCGENEDCSGKGLCYSNNSMDGYECQCCPGFVGPHCEEQDACYPSPCKNNGICVDISQGHEGSTFQCLCPYGYTGKTCEEESDPCTSMPCQNGATCVGNITQFQCKCPRGFSGPLCQHNLNECESSPCLHGICVDQEDGYKCFCQQGYTGRHCEYEYNECESLPCFNGGICTDRVADYYCSCGRGYTGKQCKIKVDLCEPNPCMENQYCVDHGNNYTCHCPTGYGGFNCLTPIRAACSTNPCNNGGTCWSSMNSFYCACRPGYTGKNCEDEFVIETITNTDAFDSENELDLQMPISIHLDHLHNVYIAVGTLACAFVIVALIVTVCHCRVNQTYKRFMFRALPVWLCRSRRTPEVPPTTNSEWFSGKDKASTATPSRNLPSLDTADMYYTLDFSDNQSSPLIQ